MKYFIDTNIFLRALVKEDKTSFKECVNILTLIKNGRLKAVISSLICAEINWILSKEYKQPKEKIIEILKGIIALHHLKMKDNINISMALDIYSQNKIKFIDSLVASQLLQEKNMEIITYDADFDKIKGVQKRHPKQIINRT